MSIIKFPSRKLNKKRLILSISLCFVLLMFITITILYFLNSSFRAFADIYLFRKETNSTNLPTIDISSDEDHFFYSYDRYIVIFNKNILYTYSYAGQLLFKNDINISAPVFASNNKFLLVAENNGNDLYLLSGSDMVWHNTIDGNISKINVNKNGYVSIIVSGTGYKSIVISFDSTGKELFKTYLSNNIAIDTDISTNNKYLSIAEVDYSGSLIKSMVKNISIEKAKTDPTNSVIYTFNAQDNSLIRAIKYQDKNNLICMYNDNINSINVLDKINTNIISINKSYEFVDINLKSNYIYTENEIRGFSNYSLINILNTQNNSLNKYEFKGSIKNIYCYGEKIAVNTGSEVHFIGLNGWLIKKYNSFNEIHNIVLGDSIAGIIYKDKIEIIEI